MGSAIQERGNTKHDSNPPVTDIKSPELASRDGFDNRKTNSGVGAPRKFSGKDLRVNSWLHKVSNNACDFNIQTSPLIADITASWVHDKIVKISTRTKHSTDIIVNRVREVARTWEEMQRIPNNNGYTTNRDWSTTVVVDNEVRNDKGVRNDCYPNHGM